MTKTRTYDIRCCGAFHEELRGVKGHVDVVARVELPEGVDPKRATSGYLCEACAKKLRESKSAELFPESDS